MYFLLPLVKDAASTVVTIVVVDLVAKTTVLRCVISYANLLLHYGILN